MRINPKRGLWGNLEDAIRAVTKTDSDVSRLGSRVDSNEEVNNITFVVLAETHTIDDNTAARHAAVFEEWREGVSFKAGNMRRCPLTGKLYRVNEGQAHTSVPGWEPSRTPAMWTLVDVTHAGTMDDPIPAGRGMEYAEGRYYFDEEDGNLYLCTRSGTLHYMPHELVGQYFNIA